MLKFHLRRPPLLAWGAIGLLVATFALAACGGSPPPATEAPAEASETEAQVTAETPKEADEAVAQSTSTVERTEPPTTTAPEEAEEIEEAPEQETVVAVSEPATCEPLEVPVNQIISPISDEDWARGPATAAVTVIELGDFQ